MRRFLPKFLSLFLLLTSLSAFADPIPVRFRQGTTHGFLLIRSEAGKLLGYGEITAMPHGDRLTARLTLHFKDGSLDDETTVFTQGSTLHFISDHHIQRGPFFSKPIDFTVEQNGSITSRTPQNDGSVKTETSHIDLPPDISNGMIAVSLLNIRGDAPEFKLGMVVPYSKGRLIQLAISPTQKQPFSCVTGLRCQANVFRIKPELGGVVGVVAPILGKQPADLFVWIRESEIPTVVREVGQLSEGGPIVSLEVAGAIFTHPKPAAP